MFAERNRSYNLISFALDSNYDATFKIGMIKCLYIPVIFVFLPCCKMLCHCIAEIQTDM